MAQAIAGTSPERANRLLFAAAVLFAALAAALVFVALQRGGEESSGGAPAASASVIVTARDIPANSRLTADMLELRSISPDAILAGAYANIEPLIGLPVRFPLEKGEQLTPLKVGLNAIEDEKDLSLVLPEGKRGFAVEVTEVTGVGGLLLPGNSVDVIAVFDESATGVDKAVTLLQNIEVLSVAQEAQEPVPALAEESGGTGLNGRRPDDVERQPGARTVTLAVTPPEAQLLALAQQNGSLWLTLRPFEDGAVESLGEVNLLPFRSP